MTLIHWADFDVEKPQAAVTQVVSVSDDIRLELDSWGRRPTSRGRSRTAPTRPR
jgi:hypothetical protein